MVMVEFGGSLVDKSVEAKAAANEIVALDPDMLSRAMGDAIELEEFQPWPRIVERTPRPSVSLVCMYVMG